jgi:transcriptional regulator with XRE-family HTH domain
MAISAHFGEAGPNRRGTRRKLQLDVPGGRPHGEQMSVRIHNISQSGMLIECMAPLEVSDMIDVELPHAGVVSANIIWTSDHLFGCEFTSVISPAAVSAAELRGFAPDASLDDMPVPKGTMPVGSPAERFGPTLKQLRIARGLCQAEIAAALAVSGPSVSGWEKGRARPKPDRLAALAALWQPEAIWAEANSIGGPNIEALQAEGLQFGRYDIFHSLHADGRPVFSVASLRDPGTFDVQTMADTQYPGILVFTVLPGPVGAGEAFDDMLFTARALATHLEGALADEKGVPLTAHRAGRLREDALEFERSLTAA